MNLFRKLILCALVPLCGFTGCVGRNAMVGTTTTRPTIYTGPTDPLDVVLAKINANNQRITTVAGSGTFLATLGPEQTTLNGQITLLHTKPDKLWLRLNKDLAGEIMIAGTNGQQFWLAAFGEVDTTWYGTTGGNGANDPRLPISPELIADVLGVATLNLDMRAEPVPTMRFNPDYDAYMLTWSRQTDDRWVMIREVWYDRETLEPRRIWLFDKDGRVSLRAKLSQVEPMDVSAGDRDAAPRVARSYDLLFPESRSRITFRFDELRATRGSGTRRAPNAKTYLFSPADVGTSKVENLDEAGAAQ